MIIIIWDVFRTNFCFHDLIPLRLLFLRLLSYPLRYLYTWLIIILGEEVGRVDAQVLHEVRLFLYGEALGWRFYEEWRSIYFGTQPHAIVLSRLM